RSTEKPSPSPPARSAGPLHARPSKIPYFVSRVLHPPPNIGFNIQIAVPVLQSEIQPNPLFIRSKARIVNLLKQDSRSGKAGFSRFPHAADHPPAVMFVTDRLPGGQIQQQPPLRRHSKVGTPTELIPNIGDESAGFLLQLLPSHRLFHLRF